MSAGPPSIAQPLVRFADVTYRYPGGEAALLDLSLAIEPGEFVLLAGANGSGKLTLCRMLNGLIPHLHGGEWSGALAVVGHDVRVTPPAVLSRDVGLLLQNPDAQCFGATVARDIAFGLACQGLPRAEIAVRVGEVAELLSVTHLLDRAPDTLSGGEQQRVALAGVLALRPALLVLDEPFAFLDAAGADELRATLLRLRRQGVTIIVAEQRLEEIAAEATRMIVLDAGRVTADGPPSTLFMRDVARWGLEAPPFVQLARAAGIPAAPLTLDAAVDLLDGQPVPWPNVPRPRPDAALVVAWDDLWFERAGQTVLRGVNLQAEAGALVALLGANGAGKTTLLRHANGLLRPQHGTVRLLGHPIGRRPVAELARVAGLVMQYPERMFFAPTVQEELEAGPRLSGASIHPGLPASSSAWDSRLLDRVPQRLSAGQQRRVALAAILAARPQALLLDEPTAGQDAAGRRALQAILHDCLTEGTAIVAATHDTEWALGAAARWAILAGGRIIADAPPAEVCTRPDVVEHGRLRLPAIAALHNRAGYHALSLTSRGPA